MTIRRYIQLTGIGAFVAFILYLYIELATNMPGSWKYLFLVLFVIFSILALVDAMRGGLEDKSIVGTVRVGKKVVKK